jgi:isoleucyl-tRNA synthetase
MFSVDKLSFSEREEKVLKLWQEEETFLESLEQRKDNALFSFYDGPPFATGLPHYGHLLAGTIKDVIPRYKAMKGYFVPRRFGWDCHGLPVENEIEKTKQLTGKVSIEEFGIAKFNEECRSIVLRYTNEWKQIVDRIGRWVDFKDTYHTMDTTFMESVWWVFKKLHDQGMVYEGFKVMPFSAKLGTPLSNFEANLNYQDVDDPSLTVKLQLKEPNAYLLIWTTTPWTLISNLAVIVGPKLHYVKIKAKDGKIYYIAESRLRAYFKEEEDFEILERLEGKDLVGKEYEPIFPYFADRKKEGAFRVLSDNFVTTEDGTGLVHAAPAFGEVDFFVCSREKIEIVCPVDPNGRFTSEIPEYENLLVKDADKPIIKRLKEEGKVFTHATIRHRYPYCWRSDTPLIYKAVETYFVSVESIKDKMVEVNKEIHWTPEHIKNGRFGKWLENARDWAISRNRYWGTPLPIWKNEKGDVKVIGSVEELEILTGQKVTDLHRHFVDQLTFEIDGHVYRRVEEVFDCWFESGSMPYAQNHYPFENKEDVESAFPADFIAEGLDQTRGWFYTLTVLSTALFNKPAFKNVIVNGILLAEDGNKMSKKLKNYPDPMKVVEKYGADAMRLYLLNSPAVRAEDLRFSEKGVETTLRQVLLPLFNSYTFLATYVTIYDWHPTRSHFGKPKASIDKWILSKLHSLIETITKAMDNYDLNSSVSPLVTFIDQLTNWYIRRCRTRFWADEATDDRRQAFETLYTVLLELSKLIAPFAPFISDAIYRQLKTDKMPTSVHLCDFPVSDETYRHRDLEKEMEYVQKAVSLGHSLRKEQKLRVRQPLAKAFVASKDPELIKHIKKQKHLIEEELNVKEVIFESSEENFVQRFCKPNFRVLGKKVGKKMPLFQKLITALPLSKIEEFEKEEKLILELEEESFELLLEDIQIERKVKEGLIAENDEHLTIAIDTALTEELIQEGFCREMINKINTQRREEGLEVTDRIRIIMKTTDTIRQSFFKHQEFVLQEVLGVDLQFAPCKGTTWDLNGEKAIIHIERVVH